MALKPEHPVTVTYTALGPLLYWKATRAAPINEARALHEQETHGYPPMGYGFYRFRVESTEDPVLMRKTYTATWTCGSSCE